MALVLQLANGQTEIRPVIAAVLALAALRPEERDDVVARRDIRHAVAYDLDDACAFVPEHCRRIAGGVGARSGVEVGVTDTAGDEPYEHLSGLRFGELQFLNLERRAELFEDCGADLHLGEFGEKTAFEARGRVRGETGAFTRSAQRHSLLS